MIFFVEAVPTSPDHALMMIAAMVTVNMIMSMIMVMPVMVELDVLGFGIAVHQRLDHLA